MDNANAFYGQVSAGLYNTANAVGSTDPRDDNYQVNTSYFQPSSRDPPATTATVALPTIYPEFIPTQDNNTLIPHPPTPTHDGLSFHEQEAPGQFYRLWNASGETFGAGYLAGQDVSDGANATDSNFAMIMDAAPSAALGQVAFSHGMNPAPPLAQFSPSVTASAPPPSAVSAAHSTSLAVAPAQGSPGIVSPSSLPHFFYNSTNDFTVPVMSGSTAAGTSYLASNAFPNTNNYTQGHHHSMNHIAAPQFTPFAFLLPPTCAPAQVEGGAQLPSTMHLDNSTRTPVKNRSGRSLRKPVPSITPPPPLFPKTYEAIINPDGKLRAGDRLDPRTLFAANRLPTPDELLVASLRARGLSAKTRLLVALDESEADSIVCVVCSKDGRPREIGNSISSRSSHRGTKAHTSGWEWALWLKPKSLLCSGRKRTSPSSGAQLPEEHMEDEEDEGGSPVRAGEASNINESASQSDSKETEEPPVVPPCDIPSESTEQNQGRTSEDFNEEAASSSVAHRSKDKARAISADLPSWSPRPSLSGDQNHDTGNSGFDTMQDARSSAIRSSQPNSSTDGAAAASIPHSEGGTAANSENASQPPLNAPASLASRRGRARDNRYRPYRTDAPEHAEGLPNATLNLQGISAPRPYIPIHLLVGARGEIPPDWQRFIIHPPAPVHQPHTFGDAQVAVNQVQGVQDAPDAANSPLAQHEPAATSSKDDQPDEPMKDN